MKITLAWPDQPLWPNRRSHWTATHRRRRAQKNEACILAYAAGIPRLVPDEGDIPVTITFHKSDRRRYDLDGALSACKGALDGLAIALGVDDSRFVPAVVRGEPTPGGAVIIEVHA